MTNFEKYKNEIKEALKEQGACGIRNVMDRIADCPTISCFDCKEEIIEWLASEYKEPEVDWSKVEVDTPIFVSGDGTSWSRRYFAKYEDGKVFFFAFGSTSWSHVCAPTPCVYAKLAEEGEKRHTKIFMLRSNCGKVVLHGYDFNYCPFCGAEIEGKK